MPFHHLFPIWSCTDLGGFFSGTSSVRIFKCLWSPGIDSKEWTPPAYVAWRAGTTALFLLGSYTHRFFKNSSLDSRSGSYPYPQYINADPKPWFKVERGAKQPQARGVAHHLRAQEVITSLPKQCCRYRIVLVLEVDADLWLPEINRSGCGSGTMEKNHKVTKQKKSWISFLFSPQYGILTCN